MTEGYFNYLNRWGYNCESGESDNTNRVAERRTYNKIADKYNTVGEDNYARHSPKHNIKRVIFNDPATIILWEDGTKTVVKAYNEPFDPEKGLAMALVKRMYGNDNAFHKVFKEWLPEEEETQEVELFALGETFRTTIEEGLKHPDKTLIDKVKKLSDHIENELKGILN